MPKQPTLHKELVRRSEFLLGFVHDLWDGKTFQNVLFTWAGEQVKDDAGMPIDDIVGCDLPEDASSHQKTAIDMVVRTSACGLLRIRREVDIIRAIMETRHGSKSWTFPFSLRGDSRVIGAPTVRENDDCVGILWKTGG